METKAVKKMTSALRMFVKIYWELAAIWAWMERAQKGRENAKNTFLESALLNRVQEVKQHSRTAVPFTIACCEATRKVLPYCPNILSRPPPTSAKNGTKKKTQLTASIIPTEKQ
jgi:hypothetical protein